MDGCRRLAMQLLVEDRLQQRLERRRSRIEPQRKRARPVNQLAQFGVAGLQMRHSFGRIKGKFAPFAAMNHMQEFTALTEAIETMQEDVFVFKLTNN